MRNGNPMSVSLVSFVVWLCAISGCLGCVIGLVLATQKPQPTENPFVAEVDHNDVFVNEVRVDTDVSNELEQVQVLLTSLSELNTQVDSRVDQHNGRVAQITNDLEREPAKDREEFVRATNLLMNVNHRLQADLSKVKLELQHQRELVEAFRQESRTDALTNLLNRRAFNCELNHCLEDCDNNKSVMSLVIVDIDRFKWINDQHGHLNGDQVLVMIAQCLKQNVQQPAFASRYGGEEFAIVLPGLAGRQAMEVAEQLRVQVQSCNTPIEGVDVAVTISVGVAEYHCGESRVELIERADEALFTAKNAGRNNCCFRERPKSSPAKRFCVAK